MSNLETILYAIIAGVMMAVVLIIIVTMVRNSNNRREPSPGYRYTPMECEDYHSPLWTSTTKTYKTPVADTESKDEEVSNNKPETKYSTETVDLPSDFENLEDRLLFSVKKEEAEVVDRALQNYRRENRLNKLEEYDNRLLDAVEEGIKNLEEQVVEAAKTGDVDRIKKCFEDIDWLEGYLEGYIHEEGHPRRR